MDERLDQMQQTIFNSKEGANREDGLLLEELIQKVIEVRPDKPVSALDMELLKAKVMLRDKQFNTRLHSVEHYIGKMLTKRGIPLALARQSPAEAASGSPVPILRSVGTEEILAE